MTFAVWQTILGTQPESDTGLPAYQRIGFDLDNTCTGEGQGSSCQEPAWAPGSHMDGAEGIDNALGQYWWTFSRDVLTADARFTELLVRVRDYSGEPDDDQVEVSLYYAFGLIPRGDGGVGPLWDGQDHWNVLPQSLRPPTNGGALNVDEPKVVDKQAYVSGGVLVARFEDAFTAYATVNPTQLWPVRQLVMAGTLTQHDGGTWELQNTMIGSRVKLTVLAQSAAWFQFADAGGPLCNYPSLYQTEVDRACALADIASGPDSPSAPCDAISMGLMVQAKQAFLGHLADPPDASATCVLEDALPSCGTAGDE